MEVNHSEQAHLANDKQMKEKIDQWLKASYEMKDFESLVCAANSDDRFQQYYGVIGLRKLLSNQQAQPIQTVIDANMIPRFIEFMKNDNESILQFEAACALTNITGTSEQIKPIIDNGGIPCFIKLLDHNNPKVAEQAIWAIKNIAADSKDFRDTILKCGGFQALIQIVNTTKDKEFIKQGTSAILSLCGGMESVVSAIPVLCKVFQNETAIDVLVDAVAALKHIGGKEEGAKAVAASGIIPSLALYLHHPEFQLMASCLRGLGHILAENEEQINILAMPVFLPIILQLVTSDSENVQREACWVIAIVTAGRAYQLEGVLGQPEYFEILINATRSPSVEVQKKAVLALSNSTKIIIGPQMSRATKTGILDRFTDLLGSSDDETLQIVLEGIDGILKMEQIIYEHEMKSKNLFVVEFENRGILRALEDLQSHPNGEIYQRALNILETHFGEDNY